MSNVYVSHLSRGDNENFTLCGSAWQGWEEPFDADIAGAGPPLPPMSKPERGQVIHQCQACAKIARDGGGTSA